MTAQSKKPKRTTNTKPARKLSSKQLAILKTKQEHPDLTTRQVGALTNTDHSSVVRTLQKYGINQEQAKDYISNRAVILAGLQDRLLSSCTDADIKEASLLQRVTATGILYDKERLERGQSTWNIHQITDLIQRVQAQDSREEEE